MAANANFNSVLYAAQVKRTVKAETSILLLSVQLRRQPNLLPLDGRIFPRSNR